MREIKFRGKDIETNQWVYGDLLQCPEKYPTIRMWKEAYPIAGSVDFVVIPETVGQFTGLKDKHDKEIRGGTGYNATETLPTIIDSMQPDYTIYPNVPKDTAYGFLTRGCPNKCQWCVVPHKEGKIRPYWDIERVANGRKKVVLMDNNILAAGDYAKEQLQKIIDLGLRVDFNQALDARLVTDEFAGLLAKVKWLGGRIRFGCDTHAQMDDCENAMDLISKHGFRGEYFLYTMLTDDIQECYYRAGYWWEINQRHNDGMYPNAVYIHAQPYRNPQVVNKIPQWQKDFARWANKRELYSTIWLDEYEPRKGFMFYKYTMKQ